MRNKILVIFCLFIYANINVQAKDVSHYIKFARTFGVVRYFSPNPYTQDWSEDDWMKVCALLINKAETQPLEFVFRPLAPLASFSKASIGQIKEDTVTFEANSKYYYYSGSGKLDVPFWAKLLMPGLSNYNPYYKKLVTHTNSHDSVITPLVGRVYRYQVSHNEFLNIQHSLPEKAFDKKATSLLLSEAKTFWKSHQSDNKTLSKRRRFIFGLLSDKSVRIADLTVRWNIIRHFYPFYEDDNLNWDYQLEDYLQLAIQMGNIDSFDKLLEWYNIIGKFLNPVKDGHLFLRRDMRISNIKATYLPEYFAQIETKVINDTLLIRDPIDSKCSWRILYTINGKPASTYLKYYRMITNAATEAHRDIIAVNKLFSSSTYNTPFIITSGDASGFLFTDTLYARLSSPLMYKHYVQSILKNENGILYIDATSSELNEKRFLAALTPEVKGLCFDLRGLPSYKFEAIMAHLISTDVAAPAMDIPVNCFPFQSHLAWRTNKEILKAKSPHVDLPAVFICDAGTVSWGETILMMVRNYNLGEIVGQVTAGTTGDMTQFNLPIFPFSMTAMRINCMDGEKHHACGIVPDRIIPVYANDFMGNYDRILQVALNIFQ